MTKRSVRTFWMITLWFWMIRSAYKSRYRAVNRDGHGLAYLELDHREFFKMISSSAWLQVLANPERNGGSYVPVLLTLYRVSPTLELTVSSSSTATGTSIRGKDRDDVAFMQSKTTWPDSISKNVMSCCCHAAVVNGPISRIYHFCFVCAIQLITTTEKHINTTWLTLVKEEKRGREVGARSRRNLHCADCTTSRTRPCR